MAMPTALSNPSKAERDFEFLRDCFCEVLTEGGGVEFAAAVARGGGEALPDDHSGTNRGAQALSISFQLLNLAEENSAAQRRRQVEAELGLAHDPGAWGHVLERLQQLGLGAEQIAEVLPEIHVEPVLTAHPTEAKRATVLACHRELYQLLVKRENQMWDAARAALKSRRHQGRAGTALARGEILMEKPDISAEMRNVTHYLRNVFPHAVTVLDRRLRDAWESAGFDPVLLDEPSAAAPDLRQLGRAAIATGTRS
jgi:phosphoenolpyruvate carboxylase